MNDPEIGFVSAQLSEINPSDALHDEARSDDQEIVALVPYARVFGVDIMDAVGGGESSLSLSSSDFSANAITDESARVIITNLKEYLIMFIFVCSSSKVSIGLYIKNYTVLN